MKIFYKSFFFFFLSFQVCAQNQLSGIVNRYAKVLDIDPCESRLTLDASASFTVGEPILIIQMKGATINESDNDGFGEIEEIGSAGLFEKNEIETVNGAEIILKYGLLNSYENSGLVQIVSFPKYENAVIVDSLIAANWDGSRGGVIAFEVEGELTIQAPVVADAVGFRGGETSTLTNDCSFLTNANDYFYSISNWRGAPKGEGIAAIIPGKEQGRGAQANGGGGGNDHNAGGGGGSNINRGGNGGQTDVSGFGCDGDFPGIGGISLPVADSRLFLGGGGGAGHDNNMVGTNGGNGGGLIVILANSITAVNQKISANGQSAIASAGDGAGGGGGGGTVVLSANAISGTLLLEAKGGNGGNQNNPTDRCIGTGGGGSGGRILHDMATSFSINLSGGMPGVNLNPSNQCLNDPANGAAAGQDGGQSTIAAIPASDMENMATAVLSQPESLVLCSGESSTLEFLVSGNSLNFQWQLNSGNGWEDISTGQGYLGESSPELEILNAGPGLNGIFYRCIVESPCANQLVSDEIILSINIAPQPDFDYIDLGNNEFQFNNLSNNANSFSWNFGDGNMSTEVSPLHVYQSTGQFEVVLTAVNDCGETSVTQTILNGGAPAAGFSASYNNPCVPVTVQFTDLSTGNNIDSYFWEFEGGFPATSIDPEPVVVYSTAGLFDVSLQVVNMFGESTVTLSDYIEVVDLPTASFDFNVSSDTAFFINNSNGATNWFWEFGDGLTSTEMNPVHVYEQSGVYQVLLTVSNQNCGSATSQEIVVDFINGVYEDIPDGGFAFYPNPASQYINVVFEKSHRNDVSISIFNLDGKVVRYEESVKEKSGIDVGRLPSGIYFIAFRDEYRTVFKRLVINSR